MAAPMRSIVLYLVRVPTSTNPCYHQLICKSTSRNIATTSFFNMVRVVRGLPVQPKAHAIQAKPQPPRNKPQRHDDDDHTSQMNENQYKPIDVDKHDIYNSTSTKRLSQQNIINDSEDRTKEDTYKLKYEKADVDDKRFGRLMMLVKSRKYREQKGRMMLEGKRLITDAIECGLQAHTIFFSRLESLEGIPVHKTRASLIKVPFKAIAMWSDVVTTQGIIGVFKKPTHDHTLRSDSPVLPLTLICDNIRDPGNLGTILRSAVAAQCGRILLTKGCVDLWEPKVLRSGAGAHFHMPITANIPWTDVPNYLDENVTVHVADNRVFQAEHAQCDSRKATHPRRHHQEESAAQNQLLRDEEGQLDISPVLESKIYHQINWRVKSAIVIGGETEGLSNNALEMCDRSLGFRVHIPMAEAVESLNSAVSASVILFEVLRQNSVQEKD